MKKLIFILALLSLSSCDLFNTRTPQDPVTASTNNVPATSPDILFNNLTSAMENKVLDNYMMCFVDSSFLKKRFRFVPSSGSSSQFPVLASWNLDAEKQYFRNLKSISSDGNSITLGLTNQVNTQFGDSAVYQYDYTLSLLAADKTISGTYQGTALFKIFLDSRNQWVIVQWEDSRKNDAQSWSDLKGRIY
jgi:hypothetical protein